MGQSSHDNFSAVKIWDNRSSHDNFAAVKILDIRVMITLRR